MAKEPGPRDNYKRAGGRIANTRWRLNAEGRIEDEVWQIHVLRNYRWLWRTVDPMLWYAVEPSQRRIVWRKRR